MAEPVTIGGETYIKTADGWIDKKTKLPVNKGLISLLDSLSTGEPTKKIRVKIDRNRDPISFAGQKYVYDLNQKVWIDEKTRMVAPESLQKTFNSIDTVNKEEAAPIVTEALGTVGIAGRQKTSGAKTNVTYSGFIPVVTSTKLNTPLVKMIDHLASIDSFLKQKIKNSKIIAEDEALTARESAIEAPTSENTSTEVKPDAEKVDGSVAGTAISAGLALLLVPQVQDAIGGVIDFVKKAGGFIMSAVDSINELFFASQNGDASREDWSKVNVENATTGEKQSNQPSTQEATPGAPPSQPQAAPENKPGLISTVTSGAITGGIIGAVLPFVSARTGAIAGAGVAAYNYFTGRSGGTTSTSASTSGGARQQASPVTTGSSGASSSAPSTITSQQQTTQSSNGASDVLQFTSGTGDELHFNNLQPETKKAVLAAATEYKQKTGQKLTLSSGGRSYEEQARLYNMSVQQGHPGTIYWPSGKVTPVAKPGSSNHGRGWAVDIGQAGDPTARAILEKHGMMWYGASDSVHYTLKGHGEGGGGSSLNGSGGFADAVGSTIKTGLEDAAKLAGMIAGKIFGPNSGALRNLTTPLPDYSGVIKQSAIGKNVAIAEAKTPTPPPVIKPTSQPNIAPASTATIENPPTSADQQGPLYYLERFGFEISGTDPLAKPAA